MRHFQSVGNTDTFVQEGFVPVHVLTSPCAFVACSLVGVFVVSAWGATVMPKLRAVWPHVPWISWRLCATLRDLRVAGSTFRGKVKDKRSQDERVNVSSLTAIKVMLPQVLASWLGSAAASGAALVRIFVVFSSVPPAAAQAAALGYSFTLEAGCKVLFGWICFFVSKALVSAAALVSSSKSSVVGGPKVSNLRIAAAAVVAAIVYLMSLAQVLMPLLVSCMACWYGILVAQDRQQCYEGLVLGLRVLCRCDITSMSQRGVRGLFEDALAVAITTPRLSGLYWFGSYDAFATGRHYRV